MKKIIPLSCLLLLLGLLFWGCATDLTNYSELKTIQEVSVESGTDGDFFKQEK